MSYTPVEELDGCELDFTENPTADEDITNLALFASTSSEEEAEERAKEWKELFDGS